MSTALCFNQGIDFNQNIFQGAPAPLVLLSGQTFHPSYIINVLLSPPRRSKKVLMYLKFKITKRQAVSSSTAVSNATV